MSLQTPLPTLCHSIPTATTLNAVVVLRCSSWFFVDKKGVKGVLRGPSWPFAALRGQKVLKVFFVVLRGPSRPFVDQRCQRCSSWSFVALSGPSWTKRVLRCSSRSFAALRGSKGFKVFFVVLRALRGSKRLTVFPQTPTTLPYLIDLRNNLVRLLRPMLNTEQRILQHKRAISIKLNPFPAPIN